MFNKPFLANINQNSIKRIDLSVNPYEMLEKNVNDTSEALNMILLPMTKAFMDTMFEFLHFQNYTRSLGFVPEGYILSYKLDRPWPIFQFTQSFEPMVWVQLLATLLVFAVITSISRGLYRHVWGTCFAIFASTFGHYSHSLQRSALKNTIHGLWLLCSAVMLSAFSGVLLHYFMKPQPKLVVDDWQELHERQDLTITAFDVSYMVNFIRDFGTTDPMAEDFSDRYISLYDVGGDIFNEIIVHWPNTTEMLEVGLFVFCYD